jgi:acyl dehydratase
MMVTADKVRAYLVAVEDDDQIYGEEKLAPPMAVVALVMGMAIRAVNLPAGAVHTGQELEFIAPVPLGSELECGATVSHNSVRGSTRFLVLQITGAIENQLAMLGRVSIAITEEKEK